MSEHIADYSSSRGRAEVAAQRVLIAALQAGTFTMPIFASDDGKALGQFLADALTTLADELKKKPDSTLAA